MCIVYGLNYLDKTTLSYASIMGIKKDIGLKGDDCELFMSAVHSCESADHFQTNGLVQCSTLGM